MIKTGVIHSLIRPFEASKIAMISYLRSWDLRQEPQVDKKQSLFRSPFLYSTSSHPTNPQIKLVYLEENVRYLRHSR